MLDVTFSPVGPGNYECDVVLTGEDDVRVFHVMVRPVSRVRTLGRSQSNFSTQASVH